VLTESLVAEHFMRLVQIPSDVKEMECDPELLKIVMVNLLGNAAKYGLEKGEIRLRVERNETGVRVSVWNEGPGFPPEQKGRLFRKFSRLQTPELLQRKGTGVGLYSVWRIIQLHGGRIWANSELGKWAEFIFEIPQPLPK
jgi:signal transduction histidine kinase